MAITYTPNSDASEAPSPAPGPGTSPVVSIPQYTDGSDPANFAQEIRATAEHVSYIQKSVALAKPRVTASTTPGFTAVIHGGSGTGTVTPSGTGYGGLNVVLIMILSGATGTATFQYSLDGGNTYSGTVTTSASYALASTGIVLAFAGTFVAADTYQFFSAFTPLTRWLDSSGNGRFLVDHNGIDTGGKITRFDESWRAAITAQTANPIAAMPYYATARVGTTFTYGTGAMLGDENFAAALIISSTAVNPSDSMFVYHGNGMYAGCGGTTNPSVGVMEGEFYRTTVASGDECRFGLFDGAGVPTGDSAHFRQLGTQLYYLTSHESATYTGLISSITVAANTTYRYKIETHNALTPIGAVLGPCCLFWMNDVLVGVSTVNVPSVSSSGYMRPGFYATATAATSAPVVAFGPYSTRVGRTASAVV